MKVRDALGNMHDVKRGDAVRICGGQTIRKIRKVDGDRAFFGTRRRVAPGWWWDWIDNRYYHDDSDDSYTRRDVPKVTVEIWYHANALSIPWITVPLSSFSAEAKEAYGLVD